jgi:chemotaxis protein methyltransferase CheR
VLHAVQLEGVRTISGLQERVLHDAQSMKRLVGTLSVSVTSMFRDPDFYAALRHKVVPLLRTYPSLRIWNAGCATGEEVYSLAVLLREVGLYDRCHIYATDMESSALDRAEAGIYPLAAMQEYAHNYVQAGGTSALTNYYTVRSRVAVVDPSLRANIVFAQHNLVTDGAFNEFNMVLCRNVLIYFSRELKVRVHGLLYESLGMFGVLGLGKRETIKFTSHERCYRELDGATRLYRKVA